MKAEVTIRRAACLLALCAATAWAAPGCGPAPTPQTATAPDTGPATEPGAGECLPLQAWFACERTAEDGTWEPLPRCGGAMTTGDRFRLAFQVGDTAHVYVLHRSMTVSDDPQTKAVTLIFPGANAAGPVTPEATLTLPGADWFTLDEQGGVTEHIDVVASRSPIAALETIRGQTLEGEAAQALARELAETQPGEALCPLPPRRTSLDPLLVLGADGEVALEPVTGEDLNALGLGFAIDHQ